MRGGNLPGRTSRNGVEPSLNVGVLVQDILKSRGLEEISRIREEDEVSERKVVASQELGLGQAKLQNSESRVQLLNQSRELGSISRLAIKERSKIELGEVLSEETEVRLFNREPSIDEATSLRISGVELGRFAFRGNIAGNRARLEQGVITVNQGGNLAERMELFDIVRRLLSASGNVHVLQSPRNASFFASGDDETSAGGTMKAHDGKRSSHF